MEFGIVSGNDAQASERIANALEGVLRELRIQRAERVLGGYFNTEAAHRWAKRLRASVEAEEYQSGGPL